MFNYPFSSQLARFRLCPSPYVIFLYIVPKNKYFLPFPFIFWIERNLLARSVQIDHRRIAAAACNKAREKSSGARGPQGVEPIPCDKVPSHLVDKVPSFSLLQASNPWWCK